MFENQSSSLVFDYTEDYDMLQNTHTDIALDVTEYGIETHLVGCESGDSSWIQSPFSWYNDPCGHWS